MVSKIYNIKYTIQNIHTLKTHTLLDNSLILLHLPHLSNLTWNG